MDVSNILDSIVDNSVEEEVLIHQTKQNPVIESLQLNEPLSENKTYVDKKAYLIKKLFFFVLISFYYVKKFIEFIKN